MYLMLDCYSVDGERKIRALAQELGIVLMVVRPVMTDRLQPLDRTVFGTRKASARRMYRLHCPAPIAPTSPNRWRFNSSSGPGSR
jgi:hypothetical protein